MLPIFPTHMLRLMPLRWMFIFCFVLFRCSFGWTQDSLRTEEKPTTDRSFGKARSFYAFPDRSKINKQLSWKWDCLGPNETPEELNPGGKAIPEYAVGRGNGTGRINRLYQHESEPEVLWACSPTGGLFITRNGGASWEVAGTDVLPISGVAAVAPDPANSEQWVVATGDGDDVFMFSNGLWLTRDNGKTYIELNGHWEGFVFPFGENENTGAQISDVRNVSRSFRRLVVASNAGLWRSIGKLNPKKIRWEKVAEGHFYDVEVIRGKRKSRDVVVAAGSKLMISYNGGRDFEEMPLPSYADADRFKFLRMNVEYSPSTPTVLWVAVTCSEANTQSAKGEGTLQQFDLVTRQWTLVRSLRKGMDNVIPTRARAFEVSPVDASVILVGNVQPVYRSTNGGKDFTKIERGWMHDDIHDFEFDADGKTVWASHDGGVSKSTDGGITWQRMDKGIGAANVFGVSTGQTTEPQVIFGGYDTGGNSLRHGKWRHVSWGDGFETITHPAQPDVMICSQQNGVLWKSHTGEAFEESVSPLASKTEWHTWIRMHPVNHNIVFCAGQRLVRSMDGGKKWEPIMDVKKMDESNFNAYRFWMSEDHPGVMYVYVLREERDAPFIYRSFNINTPKAEDIIWEKVPEIPVKGWIMQVSVDAEDPRKFWLLYNRMESDGKIWYYDGARYSDYTANLYTAKCESMVLQKQTNGRLYVGSNYGVFTRNRNDSQWTLLTGLPGTYIKSLDINYVMNKLIVGTYGRGIWQGDLMERP